MEGLKGLRLRAAALAVGLVLVGGAFAFLPKLKQVDRTEAWIAANLPKRVGDFAMIPGDDPSCTYKMDKMSYDTLKPWGIVARKFDNGRGERYDVVVIGSRSKESFHDPRQCFSAQSWVLERERQTAVPTQTRGNVPVTLVDMTSESHGSTFAMYFYRLGGKEFIGRNRDVKVEMLKHKLLSGGYDREGAFYRIIPEFKNPTEAQLKAFATKFLDEANKTSRGYY